MSRVFFFSVVVDAKFGGKVERELNTGTFGNSAQSMAARKIANNVKLQKCD
jgi:hypothetical protein